MKPRRHGTIREHQHGHYFLYIVEWEETTGDAGRKHTEIEIYYAKAKLIWNTTDPNKLDKAMKLFFTKPETFNDVRDGELPE